MSSVCCVLYSTTVFVGGCATGLFITDTAVAGIRPTKDVDAIVDIASYAEYVEFARRLRAVGLVEDTSEDAPICRWRYRELIVDVMPTDERILGFSNRWYRRPIRSAQSISIAGNHVRLVTPLYFIATKLEAFKGRGMGDVVTSHDLEDIVAVIDGRSELFREIAAADADVRIYIASEIKQLLDDKVFLESLSGFLLPDAASQARRPILEARLKAIADMEPSFAHHEQNAVPLW